uniref:Transmembrane protein n=1 Tax=Rhipicephalus appendiculatus TaxID=34631 RepID=A0A131YC17_RHIAP
MELKRWPLVSSSFSLFAFSFLHAQLAAHDHFLYVPLAIRILHHDKTAVVTKLLSSSFAAGPLPSTSPLSSLPPASFPSFSSASPSSFVFFQVTFHICSFLATDAFILCGPMFFVLTVAVSFPFKVFSAQSQPSAFLSTSSSDLLFFIPGLPSFFVTMLQLPDLFFRDSLASSLLSWGSSASSSTIFSTASVHSVPLTFSLPSSSSLGAASLHTFSTSVAPSAFSMSSFAVSVGMESLSAALLWFLSLHHRPWPDSREPPWPHRKRRFLG